MYMLKAVEETARWTTDKNRNDQKVNRKHS